jgi:cyclase
MKSRHLEVFAVLAIVTLACFRSNARAQNIDFEKVEVQTVKIADGLYVLMGGAAQGNIAVSAGRDGIFLVDSMYGQMHRKIMDALARISPQPIRYVVNTHLHGDHTAGNEAMARLGAVIVSHENMRKRMLDQQNNAPAAGLPVLTYTESLVLHLQGRASPLLSEEGWLRGSKNAAKRPQPARTGW